MSKRSLSLTREFGLCVLIAILQAPLRGQGETLEVRLLDPPAAGTVILMLFDTPGAFGELRDPVGTFSFPLDGRSVYRLTGIEPGDYAMLVYHDVNANGLLDRNFIGVPREPLAFSNGYRPKGPPNFERASFVVGSGRVTKFELELKRPLGDRGRIGFGIGMIGRSSPYRGFDGGAYQVIPALTYTGSRVQIYGPAAQVGLLGSDRYRLALTARYRMGSYEEDDSDFLQGMGDREDTLMGGIALQAELPGRFSLSAGYQHDMLDRIGGGKARVGLDRGFQAGSLRFSPRLSVAWLGAGLSEHDYGVPPAAARSDRPTYGLGGTWSIEPGIGVSAELSEGWLLLVNAGAEFLDSEVRGSPLVDEDLVVNAFGAAVYVF